MALSHQLPLFPLDQTCTLCGLAKPITEFTPNKASRYGHMKQCRACRQQQERERHAADPLKRRARRNGYRREHPEVRERERAYEDENRERIRQQHRQRYALDPEPYRVYQRAYKAGDREKWRQYERVWQTANKDKPRASRLRYWQANRARRMQENKEWCRDHPEYMREKSRKYRRAHPGAAVAMWQRRRARKMGAEGSFTGREWRALCDFYENRCLCCGATDRPLASDHVVPLSAGGSNYIFDIQPLCKHCNCVKGTTTVDYRTRSFGEFLDYLDVYPYRRKPKHRLMEVSRQVDEVAGHRA